MKSANVPLAEIGAEFLFQVIAGRAGKPALILPTNSLLRVDERVFKPTTMQGMLDRVTDGAQIIETGTESYRFRRAVGRVRIPTM